MKGSSVILGDSFWRIRMESFLHKWRYVFLSVENYLPKLCTKQLRVFALGFAWRGGGCSCLPGMPHPVAPHLQMVSMSAANRDGAAAVSCSPSCTADSA